MRILLLTQWYPPEPASLLQELAQTLLEKGHDVEVLTGFPNYPSGKLYPGYRLRWSMKEKLDKISVSRVFLYPDHSGSKIKRILNYFSFAISSAFLGPWMVSKPDVIFVYHPPLTVGIPAFLISRLWRVPFVYQVQDMWPETLRATGMVTNQSVLKWVGVFAKRVYRWAHAVLVISPGFKHNLIRKGVDGGKIYVVSNWVDSKLYHPIEPDFRLKEQLGLINKFNVMFAGNLGKAQGLETVIETAVLFSNNKKIQFIFVGDGVVLPELKRMVEEKKLNNIVFLGRYPEKEMSKLFALADVLLVHLNDDPLFQITIPHKILSYLAVGKPIIAALDGDGAEVVIDAKAGIVCPPQNPEALAKAVSTMYNLSKEEREKLGSNALQAARTKYSRQKLVDEIEDVLEQAVSQPSK